MTTAVLPPEIPNRIDDLRQLTPHIYALGDLFSGRDDLQGWFLYFLLRRYKPDLVVTAGSDLFYQILPEIRKHFPEIRIIDHLFNDEVHFHTNRAFAPLIDCTVVPGHRIAQRLLEEYRESPDRVAIIGHSIRLPQVAPGILPHGWPREFAGKKVAGFFGRMSVEKAPLDFVKIAEKILNKRDDVRFVMTGDGPEMAVLRKEIRRRRLQDRIHLAGFVEDAHEWMAACSFVVLPSHLDGMPLVVLEAQALGKPVIASRVGSVPEMIEDGQTGILCEPGDIDGFANAALRLLDSEELRVSMGEAGRERVRCSFSEETMLKRYFDLFARVCGGRSRIGE